MVKPRPQEVSSAYNTCTPTGLTPLGLTVLRYARLGLTVMCIHVQARRKQVKSGEALSGSVGPRLSPLGHAHAV